MPREEAFQPRGTTLRTIGFCVALFAVLTLVQGCSKSGGSGSNTSGSSQVRLVNATTNYPSLDMLSSSTTVATAVAIGSASNYVNATSGTNTFTFESSGSGTPSGQTTVALQSGVNYSLAAYTSGQQIQVIAFPDNEAAPASGNGKLRVTSLSADAGSLDVYLTASGASSSGASALVTYLTGSSGMFEIAKGTYHIWVTGAGNATDLRLDIPSVVISDQQILTLALTSTQGGVLVDGLLMTQGGAVVAQKNGSARIRVAANISTSGTSATLSATANGVSLISSITPVLGTYSLVPAGALSMNVTVNGSTVNVANLSAPAGADLTLLALGDGTTAPQFILLNDNNKMPPNATTNLRLVNGISGLNDTISLTTDYNLIAQNIAYGTASDPAKVNGSTISLLEVNASQGNRSLYQATNVAIQSQGVYSVFMLGSQAAPVGVLRRDR